MSVMLTGAFGGNELLKYVQINAYSIGWADSIIFKKHRELVSQGHESWVFWGRGNHDQDSHMQKISSNPRVYLDAFQTLVDGKIGFHSKASTKYLLRQLDMIDPDIIHLHIIIGYYLNVEMLFEWIAKHHCKVIWPLHDCWAFTGHCIHFTYAGCTQWKSHCASSGPCPQKRTYPITVFGGDRSVKWNFMQKQRLFTMVPRERMRLIVPSQWLADLAKQSFLGKYEIEVHGNTINSKVFKPTKTDFRERYDIGDRFIVLGVASTWGERKGLDYFIKLAQDLDPKRFAVVAVGLNRKQIKTAGKMLIALPRTDSMKDLAGIYTAADVLLNPSAEETFGMNVAEASACGTRSIVIEGSACAEVAKDAIAVPQDYYAFLNEIKRLEERSAIAPSVGVLSTTSSDL